MSQSTKRKRNQHGVEILSIASPSVAPAPPPPISRHITVDRSDTNRLRLQVGTSVLNISPEDWAVLQEHKEYRPVDSFLDFEQSVQNSLGPDTSADDSQKSSTGPKAHKERVSHTIVEISI